MKFNRYWSCYIGVLLVAELAQPNVVRAQVNSWANSASGSTFKWEDSANWSLSAPPSSSESAFITNTASASPNRFRIVNMDSVTVFADGSNGCMTVNNLTLSGPGSGMLASQSTLFLNNLNNTGSMTPLRVLNTFTLGNHGHLSITNSTFRVEGPVNATNVVINSDVLLNTGTITTTNGVVAVGQGGGGQITIAGGTWESDNVSLGALAGSAGTLLVNAGSVIAMHNGVAHILIGDAGQGTVVVSNGTVQVDQTVVGNSLGGLGALTITGGSYLSPSTLTVAESVSATGTVWLTGGVLALTNNITTATIFTHDGLAQLTVSNGLLIADTVLIASLSLVGHGTFTVAGGTSIVNGHIVLGNTGCSQGQGNVAVTGGSLFVTNAAHNAVLDLENGTLTLSAGTLVVDMIIKTNPCASFTQTGGTLVVGGVTNVFTPPPFQITSIQSDGHSIFIRWTTPGGVTNILQATNGGPDGSYNTNFVDVSFPLFISSPGTYQYNDVGGATNKPSRFYRLKQVP